MTHVKRLQQRRRPSPRFDKSFEKKKIITAIYEYNKDT